jgi:hypothetical protein
VRPLPIANVRGTIALPGPIRPRAEVKAALLAALRASPEPLYAGEAAALVADRLELTAAERALPRSSGKLSKWDNEVQWAFQDLKRDGLARGLRPGLWTASP